MAGSATGSALVIMSKDTRAQQSYKVSDSFPFKWINKNGRKGFADFHGRMCYEMGYLHVQKYRFSRSVCELDYMYPSKASTADGIAVRIAC